jgi:hypothetical protein
LDADLLLLLKANIDRVLDDAHDEEISECLLFVEEEVQDMTATATTRNERSKHSNMQKQAASNKKI